MANRVAVVGSVNSDLVLRCRRLPQVGESITASGTETHNGGKGANQAVALARLGVEVAFVGRVGEDPDGHRLTAALRAEGVELTGLHASASPTGLAVILVDDAGDNMIIVNQGANADVSDDVITEHHDVIAGADAVLVQMEISQSAVRAAFEAATGTTFLNPAPAQPLTPSVLTKVDYLMPNRTELGTLAGMATPSNEAEIVEAVERIGFTGPVVVTLGGDGAVAVVDGRLAARARPPDVAVIDTVGAGDAFCAGFVAAVTRGEPLDASIRFAVACGSHATTIRGAQPSMPHRSEAEALAVSVAVDTVATWSE